LLTSCRQLSSPRDTPNPELRLQSKYKEEELIIVEDKRGIVRKSLASSSTNFDVSNRKNFTIDFTEYSMKFFVECDPATTAEIIKQFVFEQRDDLREEIDSFAVQVALSKPGKSDHELVLLKDSEKLSGVAYHKIVKIDCTRVSQKIIVIMDDSKKEIQLTVHPDRTVQEFLLKLVAGEKVIVQLQLFNQAITYFV
jgi:hypothetical protein